MDPVGAGHDRTHSKGLRFNPFDLTKTGRTRTSADSRRPDEANRNPEISSPRSSRPRFHLATRSPVSACHLTRCCSGRAFAYADAQRNRIGTISTSCQSNQPKVPVNSYMFVGR